jgi:hypothetical protein
MRSIATGVGHEEDSLSDVRSSDVARADADVEHVTTPSEPTCNLVQPARQKRRHVFGDDDPRAEFFDDAEHLEPEARLLAREAGSGSADRDVLAGKSSAEDVDRSESCRSGFADVDDRAVCVRPVLREDAAAERILLDLPEDGTQAGPFQSELEPSHSCKERSDRESTVASVYFVHWLPRLFELHRLHPFALKTAHLSWCVQ